MTKKNLTLALILSSLMVACSSTPKQASPEQDENFVSDFPTQDRVEYVLQCVEKEGGLKYETLYPCICKIDKIAEQMSFEKYTEARTFTFLRRTPGEKGGVFRDPPQAQKLRKQLQDAEKFADSKCFVRMNK
jgi:hypothetical protein